MNIPNIRLLDQQLLNPFFREPRELVSWMGVMQTQNYSVVERAVGVRLKSATTQTVKEALREEEVLRIYVMRPTWHLVVAEDIRWMLKLSAQRIIPAGDSSAEGYDLDVPNKLYTKVHDLLEKTLYGEKSLTKQEITKHFNRSGIATDNRHIARFTARVEQEGTIRSGEDRGNKCTYTLLEERVLLMLGLTKDESLAHLVRDYFRSHSPAVLQDFVWRSGLSVSDAKQAIYLITSELIIEQWKEQTWYIHDICRARGELSGHIHLLPSYGKYPLGYRDRTDVLLLEHCSKVSTNSGLFFPIVLRDRQVIGNWGKSVGKRSVDLKYSWFEQVADMDEETLERERQKFTRFLEK